jgi:hypothetical protein
MSPTDDDRVGVLTIRVWIEPGMAHWRARITRSSDVVHGTDISSVVDSVDAVFETIRMWLEDFVGGQ